MKKRLEKGFTLIEVLVVIAIFAALAVIAAPRFLSVTYPHMKLKSTAWDILSTIEYARGKAVNTTSQYGVQFNLDASPATYRVVTRASASDPWADDSAISAKTVENGIDVFSVTVNGTTYTTGTTGVISFDPFGSAAAAEIKLDVIQTPTDRYKVTVAATSGSVSISSTW